MRNSIQPKSVTASGIKMILFGIATLSLLFSGFILSNLHDLKTILIVLYLSVSGVILIYRSHDYLQNDKPFWVNIKRYLRQPLTQILVALLFLVAAPLAIYHLKLNTLIVLVISASLGFLYSYEFSIGGNKIMLKNIFLVKNVMIGTVWGALILIGAGTLSDLRILSLFVFVSTQVLVGSMLRDIQDIAYDTSKSVYTIPVVWGIPKTIRLAYVINLLSIFSAAICNWDKRLTTLMLIALVWKGFNIYFLNKNIKSTLWGQTLNILTCSVIFILVIAITYVHIY